MKTYLDFVDAVSGAGDVGGKSQCAFCLSRGVGLGAFNLAKDLRQLDLSSQGRPWAIQLCATCSEQYLRLFQAMHSAGQTKKRPSRVKAAR